MSLIVQPTLTLSPLRYPGSENVVFPKETGMVQAFIRDPAAFKLNSYIQYVPTLSERYLWSRLERDSAVRVTAEEMEASVWKPGFSRKGMGKDKGTRFSQQTGLCVRRNFARNVGWLENEVCERWDLMATELKANASVAMTVRTLLTQNQLANGNWQGNTASANTLNQGKGFWNKASDDPNNPRYNAISATILQAKRNIALVTNGVIDVDSDIMRLVMNPDDAIAVSLAPEIRHIKTHDAAMMVAQMEGAELKKRNWGMPRMIEGVEIVVEDTPYVNSNPNAAGTESTIDVDRKWVFPSGTAYMLARPGSLVGAPGSQSFSTLQSYFFGELMQAEAFPDAQDRLTTCHTSESLDFVLGCGLAGYKISGIVG